MCQIQIKEKNFPEDLNKKIANAIKEELQSIHAERGGQPILQDILLWLDGALSKILMDPKFIESSSTVRAKDGNSYPRYKLKTPKQYANTQATAEATKNFLERCKRQEEEEVLRKAAAEAEAKALAEGEGEWVCEACTYLNSSGVKCEICEAARPRPSEDEDGGTKMEKDENENDKELDKEKGKEIDQDREEGKDKDKEKETEVEQGSHEDKTPQEAQKERYYTCRMCGYKLCDDQHIEPHEAGAGKAFANRKGPSTLNNGCTSLFLKDTVTLPWMGNMAEVEGKFSCPKCNGRIGSYHWSGAPCSCGYWTVPSIQVHKCRVDEKFKG